MKLSNSSSGDSKSLKHIDGETFTIVAAEQSNYEDKGEITPGVKLTTKETFGDLGNRFHTTRMTIVKQLMSDEIQAGFAKGDTLTVRCVQPEGKKYYVMENA